MPGSTRVMPGGSRAGCRADSNDRQQREHRSGPERCSRAVPVGAETQYAASGQHERTPFVTSPPLPYMREPFIYGNAALDTRILTMLARIPGFPGWHEIVLLRHIERYAYYRYEQRGRAADPPPRGPFGT